MNASEARMFAAEKLQELNLKGWRFVIDQRPKNRGGQCRYRTREIALSAWVLQDGEKQDEKIRDIILHEIAHAVVGPGNGHNHVWKSMARAIGAKPDRVFNADNHNLERPKHRYQATCNACGQTHGFHRKTKRQYRCRCGKGETLKFQRVL